jgi:hypothetical protein
MLITISGGVGSGKTTTAGTVVDLLTEAGLKPRYLRFRHLKLFGLASPVKRPVEQRAALPGIERKRAEGFSLRSLTAPLMVGYAARIVAFRLSRIGAGSRCDVVNRYFYDNLVQYRLDSRRERIYVSVLRHLIPKPDLAILLVASDETVSIRRANYAQEYVVLSGSRYRELPALFPELAPISTDPGSGADEEIRRLVRTLSDRRPKAATERLA